MKNLDVIKNFVDRKSGRSTNISSDGNKLMNYGTAIAQFVPDCVIVNRTKYSQTTTGIQNKVILYLEMEYGRSYIKYVDDVPIGKSELSHYA